MRSMNADSPGMTKGDPRRRPLADYDKTIALNPNYTNAYYNRGNAKANKGDHDGAMVDYDKVIELNPELRRRLQ